MTEKDVAIRILKMLLALRDVGAAVEEGHPSEFIDGWEQALDELADWLREEFGIIPADLANGQG